MMYWYLVKVLAKLTWELRGMLMQKYHCVVIKQNSTKDRDLLLSHASFDERLQLTRDRA